jgi:hypothetical protein
MKTHSRCPHGNHSNLKHLIICGIDSLHARLDIMENLLMATQADLDAVTASLATLKDTLVADDSAIQAEIAALQSANPGLDLTGLQAAVADVSAAVDATTALVPAATPGDTPPATA